MKKILKWGIAILVLLVLFFTYMGTFNIISFEEDEIGPYVLIYKNHTGAYSEVAPVMDEVYDNLKKDGIETYKGFGIYYDNPELVEESKLRSTVGSILEVEDYAKIDILKDNYSVMILEKTNGWTAEFPLRNTLSYILGMIRVYPELNKHTQANNITPESVIEIYDVKGGVIYYSLIGK